MNARAGGSFVGRAATAGVVGGVAFLLLGVESTVVAGSHLYRDVVWPVPWVFTMIALAGVYAAQRSALRRWGHVAFGVLAVAMSLVLLGNAGVVLDVETLKTLGFPGGAMLWLVAMVPAGIATYRAGVLPRRVGVLMAALEPLSIVTGLALSPIAGLYDSGNYSGCLEKGIVVILIARSLRAAAAIPEVWEGLTPADGVEESASRGGWVRIAGSPTVGNHIVHAQGELT